MCSRGLPTWQLVVVLRLHQRTPQQGRGPVHSADVSRLPGRPWPWQRPVSGHDPSRDARRSGSTSDLGARAEGSRQPPGHRGHETAAGRRRAGSPHVPGARDWPGWSDKPRSPRSWSPSAKRASPTARALVTHGRPLLCENKHGCHVTSSGASIVPATLASSVIVCRLLPVGCRAFAACSPPAGGMGGLLAR
jgi:hypothetical protein